MLTINKPPSPTGLVLPDPETHPLMRVPEAGAPVGWSRDQSYRAARDGIMPTIRMGRRVYVPTAEWRRRLGLDGGVA